MEMDSTIYQVRHVFRRHERKLVVMAVVGFVLSGALFAVVAVVDNVRSAVLERVEKGIMYWDDRWTRRVEYGESLVSSGRYAEAAEYLSRLDLEFPAHHVKHKRNTERERVFRGLAHSYAEMGKKRLTLETYRRLVEFDPRNFESHYLLAMACLQFREPAEATEHFVQVLAIHPTHLPSVRAYVSGHFEKADFASVISAYEAYLNAFIMQEVVLELGDVSTKPHVPVDGLFHNVEVRLNRPQGWSGELTVRTGGYSIEIERVTVEAPLLVGEVGIAITQVWPGESSWRIEEMVPVGQSDYRSLGDGEVMRLDLPRQSQGIATIRLRLRLFKRFDPALWNMVEKSYQNMLDYDGLARARARSVNGVSGDTKP